MLPIALLPPLGENKGGPPPKFFPEAKGESLWERETRGEGIRRIQGHGRLELGQGNRVDQPDGSFHLFGLGQIQFGRIFLNKSDFFRLETKERNF